MGNFVFRYLFVTFGSTPRVILLVTFSLLWIIWWALWDVAPFTILGTPSHHCQLICNARKFCTRVAWLLRRASRSWQPIPNERSFFPLGHQQRKCRGFLWLRKRKVTDLQWHKESPKRRFSQKTAHFADSPFVLETPAYGGRRKPQTSQRTEDFRRKPQESFFGGAAALWETDFYTPPVLGCAAFLEFSASGV